MSDTNVNEDVWARVADVGLPVEGERLHVTVDGRFITIFRKGGKLSCIDSICYHKGGPLTLGPLQDIEDLGITVVICPWHKFMFTIDGGVKVVGKAETGFSLSGLAQRPHKVKESAAGLFVVSFYCFT